MDHCCDLLIRTHTRHHCHSKTIHRATTYTSSSLPKYSYTYRIGAVNIAWNFNMVWMNKTSPLLLLYSLSLRAVASTLPLNSTLGGANELKTACRGTAVWTTPQWTSSVSYNCQRVIETLARVEPESLFDSLAFVHQFLPPGQHPAYPTPVAVRTPWKLTNGMVVCLLFRSPLSLRSSSLGLHAKVAKGYGRIGPCTMAVTTLAQMPHGFLPLEVGPGPFPDIAYSSWYLIHEKLLGLMDDCVARGQAGMRWSRKLECPFFPS